MNPLDSLPHTYMEVGEETADQVSTDKTGRYTVEIKPPRDTDIPAALPRFTANVMEIQSKWLGLRNTSPVSAFEIHRETPNRIRLQYVVPTKRLERKVRTQLSEELPELRFGPGNSSLPVKPGDSIGGGILTAGRKDHHPLRTQYDRPPTNSVISSLHRHAMQDTKFVIQVLFQPIAGQPLRNKWWRRRAYQQVGYLRKEKTFILPGRNRAATPQERKQADRIERKARNTRFHVGIRILVVGAGDNTQSRVKEIAGGFNVFEDSVSNQYLNTVTITRLLPSRFNNFLKAVHRREFNGWSLPFRATQQELAALVSIPDRKQQNIQYRYS